MSLWQMFKDRADKVAEAAREALEKQKERLGNMAEALRKWKSAISEKLDLEARLIKERQITAEYKARTEEVKAAVNAQTSGAFGLRTSDFSNALYAHPHEGKQNLWGTCTITLPTGGFSLRSRGGRGRLAA